ncbi:hypothetical protein SYN63AY4M2_01070 [Synechococcus sp. 63AY4M2]|nr:hypothetical protein SYN63AY4M2_01070 [Synechococcus sp. 63AY4M2]PIK88418.1 hypothetical protein SYN65AY6A5_04740 [Synechococcus sp. 65AY6A5]PIK94209.1 hypothetical protein SYN60AY4M2_01475 [Synechococcus sp. 60AY4M2]PIK98792.1 hypothetical protein SYN63AY4M1_12420 [Synechococcus sp. 63AY4M1]PIL00474.1 hypothetical protein SYN65AY640_01595 [Synechococcus sp. 65AY640]
MQGYQAILLLCSVDACGVMSEAQDLLPVGARVEVVEMPPYLKTADPMPMLRPAHLIRLHEQGVILQRRLLGTYSVQFANGIFLIDGKYLALVGSRP